MDTARAGYLVKLLKSDTYVSVITIKREILKLVQNDRLKDEVPGRRPEYPSFAKASDGV